MDEIILTIKGEKMTVDDSRDSTTDDHFRGGKKRKLDEENSEQKTTEKDTLVAASSAESFSNQLDERKDAFLRLGILLEVIKKIEDEEMKELKRIEEKIKRVEDSNKRVEDGNKRVEDSDKRVEDSDKRAEDSNKRAEDSNKRVEDSNKRAEDSNKRVEDSNKRVENINKRAEDGNKRAEDRNERREELEKAAVKQGIRSVNASDRGVYVQAPTHASLEVFLEHLTSIDIPYFASKVGPVGKEDVMKASSMLMEADDIYATILALDVEVERDAQFHADAIGVKIIPLDSVSQAGDLFFRHREECLKRKANILSEVVFPCICEALTSGVKSFEAVVEQGSLRAGTPLLARDRMNLELGVVASISAKDGSSVVMARAGDRVKVRMRAAEKPVWAKDRLISRVTRKSYDLCKRYCWKDFSLEEKDLFLQLLMASNLLE